MKIVSVNVEGYQHQDLIFALLDAEAPDVICLQEAPESFSKLLVACGYICAFLQQALKQHDGKDYKEGLLLAAKTNFDPQSYYIFLPTDGISLEGSAPKRVTNACGILHATIPHEDTDFHIATTHFTWTPDGRIANNNQVTDMKTFLAYVKTRPPHCMFGDFNIPRHHNPLYPELLTVYHDAIPATHESSLDKTIHKHGKNPDKANLFSDFMVDYCFTQPPYCATDVSLRFGVSDHAAVITTISKG